MSRPLISLCERLDVSWQISLADFLTTPPAAELTEAGALKGLADSVL
jgi:hypothetical protein